MEASNLGAYLADKTEAQTFRALEIISQGIIPSSWSLLSNVFLVPYSFLGNDTGELEYKITAPAENVIKEMGETKDMPSLGVPTWRYGHEPSNRFATW